MKVTITVENNGQDHTVVRTREDVRRSESTPDVDLDTADVDLDAVVTVAVLDARRACGLPRHDLDALMWLVGLPHPESAVLERWRAPGKLSLGQVVTDIAPLIPANSLDAPLPAAPNVGEAERALAHAQYNAQRALDDLRGALRRNAAEATSAPHRLTSWVDVTEAPEATDR